MKRRHRTVLRALQRAQDAGVSLTFSGIVAATGLSSISRVQAALIALEKDGYITRLRRRHRAITVIKRLDPPQYFVWDDPEKRLRRLEVGDYYVWDDQQKRLALRQTLATLPPRNINNLPSAS